MQSYSSKLETMISFFYDVSDCKMSVFGHSKPVYVNTYGRQKRRVEQWFSPDLRKKAFSFSSTPSSDQSIPELTSKKR